MPTARNLFQLPGRNIVEAESSASTVYYTPPGLPVHRKFTLGLEALVAQFANRELPPVKSWHPQQERAIDMRIDRSGTWHYNGSPINREKMVALFSSVLRKDDDHYYLVTPAEKLLIQVEDAPFLVLLMEVSGDGQAQVLDFTDNCGNRFIADRQHPVWLAEKDGEQLPYVMVRDNLPALLCRAVYYQLAQLLVEHEGASGVWSSGTFFPFVD